METSLNQSICHEEGYFVLNSRNTTYSFHVLPTGHLEHLYYGAFLEAKISQSTRQALSEKTAFLGGNLIAYSEETPALGLELLRQEISSSGKGDVREPFMELVYADGSATSDFVYQSYEIFSGKPSLEELPSAYGSEAEVTTLKLTLVDRNSPLILELNYHVFYDVDVIAKSARLINPSEEHVSIRRFMSNQVDFEQTDFVLSTFSGAWVREMEKNDLPCSAGSHVIGSVSGVSSNRMNPFFMLSARDTTEDHGACYGFNLIYSGNHFGVVEVTGQRRLRVQQGIHPRGFMYDLAPKKAFQSPESIMTFSDAGHTQMSHQLHAFVRRHIVRGAWQFKPRPVLLNSWEAAYFDFNERKLLKLAESAKEVGIELFVMDDGWFGNRKDDTCALGDWDVNLKKLPNGIKGLAEKIHQMGLLFGIWVEPEMISENSELYKAHPEWAVQIPNKEHSKGRHQYLLDLTQRSVQDFVIDAMTKVFSSGEIDYVKWDMNRIFSDAFSKALPAERQGEFSHRYVLGLYRILEVLVEAFPNILFESCASGGNRFDLGMLCYMPQIWASDNTDALSRMKIQNGYSYGYPQSVIGAHVSDCPNHQTLRSTPLSTRYKVASFGLLGYECHLSDYSKEDLKTIKAQVEHYKKWRDVFQFGNFYRVFNPTLATGMSWTVVSEGGDKAVTLVMQELAEANPRALKLYTKGLKPQTTYEAYNIPEKVDIRLFGDLINTVSPIHIKKESLVHDLVAKFYKLEGEKEHFVTKGAVFNQAGVFLKQGFAGVGFNEEVRIFPDFASRMYFFKQL